MQRQDGESADEKSGMTEIAGHPDSIFRRVTREDLCFSPFPHVHVPDCLAPPVYHEIAGHFPDFGRIAAVPPGASNVCRLIHGRHFLLEEDDRPRNDIETDPLRRFMAFHTSRAFYLEVLRLFGEVIRNTYPFLETRLGKRLEEASVGLRGQPLDTDFTIDCQVGFNSPVLGEASRVRGPHVDKPFRLVSGLLYFRVPEDDSSGGDLTLCRFKGSERVFYGNYEVRDEDVEEVECVPYEANRLIFFLNSPDSVHAVTPRSVTGVPRRYINFLVEARQRLF